MKLLKDIFLGFIGFLVIFGMLMALIGAGMVFDEFYQAAKTINQGRK